MNCHVVIDFIWTALIYIDNNPAQWSFFFLVIHCNFSLNLKRHLFIFLFYLVPSCSLVAYFFSALINMFLIFTLHKTSYSFCLYFINDHQSDSSLKSLNSILWPNPWPAHFPSGSLCFSGSWVTFSIELSYWPFLKTSTIWIRWHLFKVSKFPKWRMSL